MDGSSPDQGEPKKTTRRNFLIGGAVTLGAAALTAVGLGHKDEDSKPANYSTPTPAPTSRERVATLTAGEPPTPQATITPGGNTPTPIGSK